MDSNVDWYQRGLEDQEYQDGKEAEPDYFNKESIAVITIPKVNDSLSPIDGMSKEDLDSLYRRENFNDSL